MAELHLIPVPIQGNDIQRHVQALTRALEAGTDLGPRGVHIQALGKAIDDSLTEMRKIHKDLYKFTEKNIPQASNVHDEVGALIEKFERLMIIISPFLSNETVDVRP